MRVYLEHWLDALRTSLWFVPTVFAAAALMLAMVLIWVDSTVSTCDSELLDWLCTSDADAAPTPGGNRRLDADGRGLGSFAFIWPRHRAFLDCFS
jgi:hypothetical protein